MRVDRAIRLSNYLTLGLACACLGYAELIFLPRIPFLLVPLGLLLLLAYFLEGRWTLPVWAANVAGLLIIIGWGAWVVWMFLLWWSNRDWSAGTIPWPTGLLPLVGPLLMLLLLVKLYRPKRQNDYWLLHTIGFLQVALACVLADDALFGLFFFAYLACGLWCLILLQLHGGREQVESGVRGQESGDRGQGSGGRGQQATRTPDSCLLTPDSCLQVPWRWAGLWQAVRWTLTASVLGLILFLAMPRQMDTVWDATSLTSSGGHETGFRTEVDMNARGSLRVNEDPAFQVTAVDGRGRPKTNLNRNQRWRSMVLDIYHEGRWQGRLPFSVPIEMGIRAPLRGTVDLPNNVHRRLQSNRNLPDLGPAQYFLTFTMDRRKSAGLVLAEPIHLSGDMMHPIHPYRSLRGRGLTYYKWLFFEHDGTLMQLPRRRQEGVLSYRQVTAPPPPGQEEVSVPRWLGNPEFPHFHMANLGLSSVRRWTRKLLNRLADEGRYGLTPRHLQMAPDGSPVRVEHRQVVARALCQYLATSGDYRYSLDLRQVNRRLDPALDFLTNVKQGTCERFAGALALMLRSQGIPARVVIGYRGAEHLGEGRYLVRQSHAHSWVEALVKAREVDTLAWLTLDPTPAEEAGEDDSFSLAALWESLIQEGGALWRSFVVNFDPRQQREAAVALGRRLLGLADWLGDSFTGRFWTKPRFWILVSPVLLVLLMLGKRWRRRRSPAAAVKARPVRVAFYARLLAVLARRCRLRPQTGQTPHEFGEAARRLLEQLPATAALADIPVQVVDRFYQVRFGDRVLPEAEHRDIDDRLNRLDQALAGRSQGSVNQLIR
jgi:hypothetical protein